MRHVAAGRPQQVADSSNNARKLIVEAHKLGAMPSMAYTPCAAITGATAAHWLDEEPGIVPDSILTTQQGRSFWGGPAHFVLLCIRVVVLL